MLLYIGVKKGQTAAVDAILAILGKKGEKIAKILTQFFASNEPEQSERGYAIFKAISKGEPTITVIDNANQQYAQGTAPAQN